MTPTRRQLRERYNEAAERASSRARKEFPGFLGIFVHGSVARGEPGPFSDIDMVCVTGQNRKPLEYSFFDGDIYVGMGFLTVTELKEEFSDPKRFFWARGSAQATRILYDPKKILQKIMFRGKGTKPSRQVLEKSLWDAYHNLIEYSGKLRNGWLGHDEYLTRYSAQVIAQYAQRAIIALNNLSVVSENYVWNQVLGARNKPKHLRADYPVSLGIKGTGTTSRVYWAAKRLCGETLRLIKHEFEGRVQNMRFKELLAEPLEKHGL